MNPRALPHLEPGQIARIADVLTEGTFSKRLADLGFIAGAELEMVRPGDPCIVRIGQTCIGLGAGHQACIRLSTS